MAHDGEVEKPDVKELEARLADVERASWRWRRLTLLAMGLAALPLLNVTCALPPLPTSEVRARAFVVVDGRGEELGRLGANDQGEPTLTLKVSENAGVVQVGGLGGSGAGFAISGEDSRIMLSTEKIGAPTLGLESNGRRVILGLAGDGSPGLLVLNGAATLSASTEGIRLKDRSGRTVFATGPAGRE